MASLARFHSAQERVYQAALSELRAGRKRSHWMWFIFPQIAGLGTSDRARFYALADIDEARAYLSDPLLGPRLRSCIAAVLDQSDRSAEEVFGYPDVLKFQSCLTLFERADPGEDLFPNALSLFYQGVRDRRTLELLGDVTASG